MADLLEQPPLGLVRRQPPERVERGGAREIGQPEHDSIVRRLHLDLGAGGAAPAARAQCIADASREHHPPWRVHPAAEQRVQHDAHGVRLVAKLLDDEQLLIRNSPGRRALLLHVLHQRLSRRLVALVRLGDAPDIGATERGEEESDTIFADGFD